jgi:hypothetical protein
MPGKGDVIHRSKQVSRLLAALLIVPAIFSTIAGATVAAGLAAGTPAALGLVFLAAAIGFVFLALTLSVLRTVVTSEEVHVQYGLWGPRIPVRAIRKAKVVKYDVVRYGGWGLKYRKGSWAYTMPGHPNVVELEWEEDGKTKHAVVSSEDPEMLARKINQARAVRIATGDTSSDEEQSEAEQEALAAEEADDLNDSRNRV